MAPTIQAENIYAYQSDAEGIRTLLACAVDGTGAPSLANNVLYWDINGVPQSIFTPATLASNLRAAISRDYAYFTDGVFGDLRKWNFTNGLSKWGITQPASALLLGTPSSGNITLLTGRQYYVAYFNATTQDYSDLSPISPTTGPLTSNNQPLTSIPVSAETEVTDKLILATADGGDPTVLYEVTSITNATTSYTDNTAEVDLLEADVWQYTDTSGFDHGLAGNQPPPNGSFPTKHNGRLFMASGQALQFSKSLDEILTSTGNIAGRYESAWPVENEIDISETAEQIRGLLSNGTTLYIGTETQIHQLTGSSAADFGQPTIQFSQTGLLTQNVWQVVYLENTPIGTMWVTPDFRVLGSDFNTFENVGVPIQTTLNTINPSAINNCWSVFVGLGPYNFYVLNISTGTHIQPDTMCVFDLRLRRWFIWQCFDSFISGIFYVNFSGVARWIVVDATGTIRSIDPTAVMDRQGDPLPVGITSTIESTWLSLGDTTLRKSLNEVEIETTEPTLAVTVEGASTIATFATPVNTLVSGVTPILSAFGEYKVPLAGTPAKDRYYRYTVETTSDADSLTSDVLLGAVNFEVVPIHRN